MQGYERAVIRLFEHCEFTYDPGPPPRPNEPYAQDLVDIPWDDLSNKVIRGYWIRSVALHLRYTREACDDVFNYLRLMPDFLTRGWEAMPLEWQEDHLPVPVSDELRLHVFCLIAFSESIRDEIRSSLGDKARCLVPTLSSRRARSSDWVAALAGYLVTPGGLAESDALWVARQLSGLSGGCARTRQAIEELVHSTDGDSESMIQAFSNVQAAMLDLARVLIEAEYAVDVWGSHMS